MRPEAGPLPRVIRFHPATKVSACFDGTIGHLDEVSLVQSSGYMFREAETRVAEQFVVQPLAISAA